jgi:hypothetical protein
MRREPSLKAPMDKYLSSDGVSTRGIESGSCKRGGMDTMPLRYDSTECLRDRLGVGGWLWRKFRGSGGSSRVEMERVATPGVWMMDRLRTGKLYNEASEFARVMGALGGCVGLELLASVSVATVVLISDMVPTCSRPGSSVRFSKRFASYELRL